jgi:formylglycine-generating enzyme required for sulfatase activity
MKNSVLSVLVVVSLFFFNYSVSADTFGTGDNAITIDFVPISGATNPTSGYGIVNKDYRMGTYEISNDQWTKFKAAYGTVTGSELSPVGAGTAYDREPRWPGSNLPTSNVSWYEAAQFVNYLNTSTGHTAAYKFTGTIHTSNYTLGVWGAADADGTNLYRNKNAKYFLPTENEWVKAAYWNGSSLQTYSNASAGDLVGGLPDPTKWNYSHPFETEPWNVTRGVQELNGTHNMMGNVREWMESPYFAGDYLSGSLRRFRGGFTSSYVNELALSGGGYDYSYYYGQPSSEYGSLGFRVASIIPEPASALLMLLGAGWMGAKRKR